MTIIGKYVQEQTDDQLKQLVADYEEFETKGKIGDCALRYSAEWIMVELGTNSHVVTWMEKLAFEAYRELYRRSLR